MIPHNPLRNVLTSKGAVMAVVIAVVGAMTTTGPNPLVGFPPVAAASNPAVITVATYNICQPKICQSPPWQRRSRAIVRNIVASAAEVVAVQEMDQEFRSLQHLTARLARHGYAPLDDWAIEGAMDLRRCVQACATHLFYRPDTFTVIGASTRATAATVRNDPFIGLKYLSELTPPATWGEVKVQPFAYAFLRHRATGQPVLAVSLHLPSQKHQADAAKNVAVRALAGWCATTAANLGLGAVPTLLMGDYNAYRRKHPNGPQRQLETLGYVNAERAVTKVHRRYATINRTPADARWDGFPPRPRIFGLGGPRIDSIMAKGFTSIRRHVVFVRTTRSGRFERRYQGSDHNLVKAKLRLPQ